MEAAKLEGVHSGLSRLDCGLRQPTPTLTPANRFSQTYIPSQPHRDSNKVLSPDAAQ
jgi:hypothetical protein